MSALLLTWIGLSIFFLIVEMFTATFYGLSLALASALVAVTTYLFPNVSHLGLAAIFLVGSAFFSLLLPKLLQPKGEDLPQGIDRYVGEKRSIKKVAGDWKITLDGVEYLVTSEEELSSGDRVEVMAHRGAGFLVKRIEK